MDKVSILLSCSGGMSTSMLIDKMVEEGKKQGIEAEVSAVSTGSVNEYVQSHPVDILLLGPQVRFEKDRFQKALEPQGIKVAVIDMSDYGMMKGDKIFNDALKLLEE